MFMSASLFAQKGEWKIERSGDCNVTVKHRFSERFTGNSKKSQVVEYIATATTTVSMVKLVAVLKDVSKHKNFLNQKTSTKVKTLSDNECIVYYFYDGFWPYPSSDLAAKMKWNENVFRKETTFTLTGAPSLFEDKGVRRLDFYNLTYRLKNMENASPF